LEEMVGFERGGRVLKRRQGLEEEAGFGREGRV
jgi:hypothetical protein